MACQIRYDVRVVWHPIGWISRTLRPILEPETGETWLSSFSSHSFPILATGNQLPCLPASPPFPSILAPSLTTDSQLPCLSPPPHSPVLEQYSLARCGSFYVLILFPFNICNTIVPSVKFFLMSYLWWWKTLVHDFNSQWWNFCDS